MRNSWLWVARKGISYEHTIGLTFTFIFSIICILSWGKNSLILVTKSTLFPTKEEDFVKDLVRQVSELQGRRQGGRSDLSALPRRSTRAWGCGRSAGSLFRKPNLGAFWAPHHVRRGVEREEVAEWRTLSGPFSWWWCLSPLSFSLTTFPLLVR